MRVSLETRLEEALGWWVDFVRRTAIPVLAITFLLAVGSAIYTVKTLTINVNEAAMFPEDLHHRVLAREFNAKFPMLQDTMLVVVEAPTPAMAQLAALQLSEKLLEYEGVFHSIFAPGADPFIKRIALLHQSVDDLEEMGDHLASVQPYIGELGRDPSLRGFFNLLELTFREGGDSVFEDSTTDSMLIAMNETIESVLGDSPKTLAWDEVLSGRSSTRAERRQFIVVQPVLNFDLVQPAVAAVDAIHYEAEALGFVPEYGYRVRLTGEIALLHDDVNTVMGAGASAAAISFVLVAIIVFLALRSARLIASILLTLLVGLSLTSAFAAAAVGELNILSMTFGALIIGLAVDFGIHFCMGYWENTERGESHEVALRSTGKGVGVSLVLCAVTTSIGFFAFQITDYLAVAHLGLICGAGMFICLISSLTLIPALLTVWPGELPSRQFGSKKHVDDFVFLFPVRYRRGICRAGLVLGIGSLALLPRLYFDYNPAVLRDLDAESVQVFLELLEDDGGALWSLSKIEPDLETAREKVLELRELDVVKRAFTIYDLIPEEQEEKLEILEDVNLFMPPLPAESEKLPAPTVEQDIAALHTVIARLEVVLSEKEDPEAIPNVRNFHATLLRLEERLREADDREGVILLLRNSLVKPIPLFLEHLYAAIDPGEVFFADIPEAYVERMITPDGRYRVEVYPSEDLRSSDAMFRFRDSVGEVLPDAVGMVMEIIESGGTIVGSFREALTAAVIVMLILLFLIWRRIDDMMRVMLPLALGALLTCASMVLLGMSFNYSNVIVLPLMLGIGVDTGIHLVHRYRIEKIRGVNLLRSATSQAVFYSSMTTFASFGSLSISRHMGMATLGRLLAIGIVFTLICNLILLPALLETGAKDPVED